MHQSIKAIIFFFFNRLRFAEHGRTSKSMSLCIFLLSNIEGYSNILIRNNHRTYRKMQYLWFIDYSIDSTFSTYIRHVMSCCKYVEYMRWLVGMKIFFLTEENSTRPTSDMGTIRHSGHAGSLSFPVVIENICFMDESIILSYLWKENIILLHIEMGHTNWRKKMHF